jgi:hypothetical protein
VKQTVNNQHRQIIFYVRLASIPVLGGGTNLPQGTCDTIRVGDAGTCTWIMRWPGDESIWAGDRAGGFESIIETLVAT